MSRPKDMGTRYENEVMAALEPHVRSVERCGAVVGHPGDLKLSLVGTPTDEPHYGECKIRKAGAFATMYKWLTKNDNDFLFIRAKAEKGQKRPDTLVVMRIDQFTELLDGRAPSARRDK